MKSYLQVSDKENQRSLSNAIATLNEVTFESEESWLPATKFQVEGDTIYRLDGNAKIERYTSPCHGSYTIHTTEHWNVYWKFLYWHGDKKKETAFSLYVQTNYRLNFKPS